MWMCLGGHNAWVSEEEVWRTAYSHLSLCAIPLPVCVHQDLSKSHLNSHAIFQHFTSVACNWLKWHIFSSLLHSGRYVLWRHFYQSGSWVEHLPSCCPATNDYCAVHRHRSVHFGYTHFLFHWNHGTLYLFTKVRGLINFMNVTMSHLSLLRAISRDETYTLPLPGYFICGLLLWLITHGLW